jgi:hypothetical protein
MPTIPKRMNLVDIKVKVLARAGRVPTKNKPAIDKQYRRPRGRKTYQGTPGTYMEFKAQVYFDRQEERLISELGDSPSTDGHLTMRKTTFDALPTPVEKGDLIIEIAGDGNWEYEVQEVRHAGYLRGRANLIMIFFERSRELKGNP